MFLDQNCLLFHVITAVSSDIDDMVFKKLFKDCIDVIASSDTSHANYDRNTTHSPYTLQALDTVAASYSIEGLV